MAAARFIVEPRGRQKALALATLFLRVEFKEILQILDIDDCHRDVQFSGPAFHGHSGVRKIVLNVVVF